jgi:hypothetical protein
MAIDNGVSSKFKLSDLVVKRIDRLAIDDRLKDATLRS